MAEVFFFLAAIGAVAGAVGTVALRNPFYAVLALVCHLLALAALFLLLRAEFVAAAQVVVYAGAVMVLYVFVVAYVGGQDEPLGRGGGAGLRAASALFAGALFVELCIAVLGSGLSALGTDGAPFGGARGEAADTGFGTAAEMGRLFLTKFLVAFEVASLLLLIAAVGAVILARRRAGLEDPREISVADVMSGSGGTRIDAPTESMLEAGGPANR
ncbi:MAG: NADH-quinone oxidoreductase subunit J family protein [Solirubrobacteraceae bacterium]